jgi:hypothetical protein
MTIDECPECEHRRPVAPNGRCLACNANAESEVDADA